MRVDIRRRRRAWVASVALAVVTGAILAPVTGCNKGDDGMTQQQQQDASRLNDIAKKADGDWSKVPPADQDYVAKNFTSGDVNAAKMLIMATAGKIHGTPGGAPSRK